MTLTEWPDLDVEPVPYVKRETPEVTVSLPPFEVLVARWAEISGMLAKSTSRTGCFEPIDVLMLAMAGRMSIWLCMRGEELLAVLVSQVTVYPRRRILEMMFAGGSGMSLWRDIAVAQFDRHARELNCSHIACAGRVGWARAWGGEPTGDIVMVREV